MLRWYEATDVDTKKPPCVENPNKAVFTSMCWDYKDQELYVSDEKGHVFVINVYDEERFFKKRLVESKINRIEIVPNARYLLVMTDYDITSFRIKNRLDEKKGDILETKKSYTLHFHGPFAPLDIIEVTMYFSDNQMRT